MRSAPGGGEGVRWGSWMRRWEEERGVIGGGDIS